MEHRCFNPRLAPWSMTRTNALRRVLVDVAKPKSLRAAENAKVLEEQKFLKQELLRQEREQYRAKAAPAASGTPVPVRTPGSQNRDVRPAKASAPDAYRQCAKFGTSEVNRSSPKAQPSDPPRPTPKRAHRRSAVMEEETPPPAAPPLATIVDVDTTFGLPANAARVIRPPVPAFNSDPSAILRRRKLPPKKPEDNYELSDVDPESDDDARESTDRSRKQVPDWSKDFTAALSRQTNADPDSIFSHKVPPCRLEDIFGEGLYREAGKTRPVRRRGSSSDWTKDRLTHKDVRAYKERMGHKESWQNELLSIA